MADDQDSWREMPQGKSKYRLTLGEERALIAEHQAGSRTAAQKLLTAYEQHVTGLGRRIALATRAQHALDDITQRLRIALLDRMGAYNPELSTARLFVYAYRRLVQLGYQEACNHLSTINLPQKSNVYRAHKLLDDGMSPEDVAAECDLSPDQVAGLSRDMVSMSPRSTPGGEGALNSNGSNFDLHQPREVRSLTSSTQLPDEALDHVLGKRDVERARARMDPADRLQLDLLAVCESAAERAALQGLSGYELGLLERRAVRRLAALTETEGA